MREVRRSLPILLLALVLAAVLAGIACGGPANGRSEGRAVDLPPVPAQAAVGGGLFADQGGLRPSDIATRLVPSIVRVQTEAASLGEFGEILPRLGVGSGVIIDTAGHVVTSAHVVRADGHAAARISVVLADGRTVEATIAGVDRPTDLAVLKIDAAGLTPVELGDSSAVVVGQDVVAIGYALGLQGAPTVSAGVISARGRTIREDPYVIDDALQTDAGINPGNSGGPLVDGQGRVIGINMAIIAGSRSLGFAISINAARPIIGDLVNHGRVQSGYLGIAGVGITPGLARSLALPTDNGVGVSGVEEESPAAMAGLQPDDIVVAVGGKEVDDTGGLVAALADHRPGEIVTLDLFRNGRRMSMNVTLGLPP